MFPFTVCVYLTRLTAQSHTTRRKLPKAGIVNIPPYKMISNNVVCATSKVSDQPAHTRSLIRAFASRMNNLWLLSYCPNSIWSFLAYEEAAQACPSLFMSKCHIVGNHMSRLNYDVSYSN